jgi:hypothetical protein
MNGELPISTLRQIIWGDNEELDKVDLDAQPNPMDAFVHRAQVNAALAKSSTGTSVVLDMSVPSDDVDSEVNSPMYKIPKIVKDGGRRTLAKKLGITRSEEVTTADGSVWVHGFGADGQLIDARLLRSAE